MSSVMTSKPRNLGEFARILLSDAGRRGGESKSKPKREAAVLNGRKSKNGGRPKGPGKKKRTLLEYLLRAKLTPSQHEEALQALVKLSIDDRKAFKSHFALPEITIGYEINLGTTDYEVGKVKRKVRPILRTFNAWARWYIKRK